MKQLVLIIFTMFIVFSCETKTVKEKSKPRLADSVLVEKIMNKYNINADVKVSKSSEFSNGIVDISFRRPYRVIGPEFQDVLISYIAYHLFKEQKLEGTVGFDYYLDVEKNIKEYQVSFNSKKINKLPFDIYPKFTKLVEYCLTNFESGHDLSFDMNIEVTHKISPNNTKVDSFFKLLLLLSMDTKPSLKNNGDVMFMTFYDHNVFLLYSKHATPMSNDKKEMRELEIKYIKDFWKIAKGKPINKNLDFLIQIVEGGNGNGTD